MAVRQQTWWKGAHGEWYVVVQVLVIALVIFGPASFSWFPAAALPASRAAGIAAVVFMLGGLFLAATGAFRLGRNLTPLPHPRDDATLVQSGAYRLVRHPIYSGIIFMALGWSLWLHSLLTLGYTILLFIFLDLKSRREERFLMKRFPQYADYSKHVRRLIPFVY